MAPLTTTTWPTGQDLIEWQRPDGQGPVGDVVEDTSVADEVVADATAQVLSKVDPDKLPDDVDACPRPIARAIILIAAHLMMRRSTPNGVATVGDGYAVRADPLDRTAAELLKPWRLGPMP